ncbi:MAG: rod shape-determining protein RodA, partial [Rikenellaceae bacterium]
VYILTITTLVGVLLFGREVSGARSWFEIGSFRLQPAEFAKFATGLAVASYMNSYGYSVKRFKNLAITALIAFFPAVLIVLQNDTGSALVYSAFLVVLYREGFAQWFYVVLISIVTLFILSFLLEAWFILGAALLILIALEAYKEQNVKYPLIYTSIVLLAMVVLLVVDMLLPFVDIAPEYTIVIAVAATLPLLISANIRRFVPNAAGYALFFFVAATIVLSVDFIFYEIAKPHQQKRFLVTLGLLEDAKGSGYNVIQSEIAIGSGGLIGKGYLDGTQTKFKFVPEQSTDFIFCTVGEEWGFVGSIVLLSLYMFLILRLMRMGDNQRETFGRVYCYFTASVLLFHVVVNLGMTIGLLPVIGIPLPFFSYGGSSLVAFTLLLFIAIKINCRKEGSRDF